MTVSYVSNDSDSKVRKRRERNEVEGIMSDVGDDEGERRLQAVRTILCFDAQGQNERSSTTAPRSPRQNRTGPSRNKLHMRAHRPGFKLREKRSLLTFKLCHTVSAAAALRSLIALSLSL